MMNTRTANAIDGKRQYQAAEKKVRYRLSFHKCPNCDARQLFRYYLDDSLWCYECSWRSGGDWMTTGGPLTEAAKAQERPKTDLTPRLVKRAS